MLSLRQQTAIGACLLGCSLTLPSYGQDVSTLSDFLPCTIGNGAGLLDAQCSTLTVPLDYQNPDGPTIDLRVAKLTSRSKNPQPDAFTLLAGGPGQSATESFPSVSNAFRHIRAERDIVLLDQRGTGESNKLTCPNDDDNLQPLMFDAARAEEAAKRCFESLENDPQFFTTSVAIKDLELLRETLAIPQWNLYGVSYGTRVGLHYLRRYPSSVRTIVLDAVVPPEVALGPESALSAQRALLRLFDRCENDAGCNEAFPRLRSGTLALLDSLKQQPVDIQFEDISTGKLKEITFTDRHLAVTMRLMSYSAYGNAILPSMLYDAIDNDNFASLARQAQLQVTGLNETLAGGMYNAVICTEDEPFINHELDRSELEATYLGAELLDAMRSHCKAWDAGIIDDDFKTPVVSDTPALLLSGSDDPITPPAYAEQVMQHMSNAKHIVNKDQAHMQAALGCLPKLMAEFIKTTSVNDLPDGCLHRLSPQAFFVDANGPLP